MEAAVVQAADLENRIVNSHDSLVDLLERRAEGRPADIAYRFLVEGRADGRVEDWTYEHLAGRARAIARVLERAGASGRPVLLLYPPGLEFIAAFFGCLYAGALAVPAYPPEPARLSRGLSRLQAIAADAGASAVLTTSEIAAMSRMLASSAPDLARLAWIASDEVAGGEGYVRPGVGPESVAFLQYTSGSTSAPKGVVVTHGNLLHNQAVIYEAFGHDPSTLLMGWLPLFHDMGLIGHVIQPLYVGTAGHLMAPQDFLRRPVEWLRAVSRFRVTTSGAPDFAWALCARKATDQDIAGLDLSSWRVAYSGAEPVRAATLRAFADRMAPAGFRPEFQVPVYGLAEGTLMTTASRLGRGPRVLEADAVSLERGRLAGPAGRSVELTSVGGTCRGMQVRIVDPETRSPLPEGEVGEIWAMGPSVAKGYWRNEEATAATFGERTTDGEGPWLRTGDLGVIAGGELFVTGRAKDLIIVRGRNLYPSDIEEAVEACHAALVPGGSAAFAIEAGGEERLAVACEVVEGAEPQAVADAVRGAVAQRCDVGVHAVALLGRRALPKTSSGKRQRRAARQGFVDGTLEEIARVVFAEEAPGQPEPEPVGEVPRTRAEMEAFLTAEVGRALGRPAESIGADETFASLGLDSVRAVALASRLDARLGRPLHASILYNIPTVAGLAAWLVDGAPSASSEGGGAGALYPDLARAMERLDRRKPEAYRFDLERDVPWARTGEPGLYVPAELFAALGIDVAPIMAEPRAWELLQAASAINLCTGFEVVEVTITLFIDTRWSTLGATRSIAAFREEEIKHVRLFRRYADALRALYPDLHVALDWQPSWGIGFWELFRRPELFPDERVFHYLFWFFFVAFEEHSIYIADILERAEGVQPAWLAAHRAHRSEELQHVATDHGYVSALSLPEAERDAWSEVCAAWLCQHFETFFALGSARRLVAERFPHLAPHLRTRGFVRSPFLQDLLSAPSFRRTRLACPYLRDLQRLDPSSWPTDAELARRLPEAWMAGREVMAAPTEVA